MGESLDRVFRIPNGPHVGDILDSIESLEAFAPDHGPGRFNVDEHSLDPFPRTRSRPGREKAIHLTDGQIVLDPVSWQS